MAPSQDKPLEKVIDEVLKKRDVQALSSFLQRDIHEAIIKCPQQFLSKLDTFVSRSLAQKDVNAASLGLTVIYKCGKNVKVASGCQGLSEIIAQGLITKMVEWFEKCRQLWIECGPHLDKTLFNLSEDFFEALMAVHEACKEGTCEITESFLYPLGQLAVDPRVYILIKKEAICTFNIILDKMPPELKQEKKIRTSQEAVDIMTQLADKILEGGDYDFQIALMEALFRMTSADQRKKLADGWFSMQHVSTAFVKILDSEFETDCRKFLNLVNGMQGDKRRVYSYPCLEVHLDKHELLMPTDEKLEEFWIDFNLSSHSISFYFSLADGEAQDGQWETICINENEVESYTVKGKGKRQILQLNLSEVVVVGSVEGSRLTIYFSSSLDIQQAACSVYGHSKNKDFVGKTGTSVVKTTVKIIMEENSSQSTQVVPESQVSLGEKEKNTPSCLLPTLSAPIQTPAKMRISESTTFISNSSAGGSVHSAISLPALLPSKTSAKGKGKPSLEMVPLSSVNRREQTTIKTGNHGTTPSSINTGGMIEQIADSKQAAKNKVDKLQKKTQTRAVDMIHVGQREEQTLENDFVPDTQPRTERKIPSNWTKMSVSEILMMPTQKMKSPSRNDSDSSLAQQPLCPASAQKLSIPSLGPITQNQLNVKLIQRQQGTLNEMEPNLAPQELANRDSKGDRRTSKEQQAQRNGLGKGKRKGQILESEASDNAPGSKTLQKKTPNVEAKNNRSLTRKEKRDAEVTSSMVKLISSHYEIKTQSMTKSTAENIPQSWIPPLVNRPIFNMSWKSNANREDFGAVSLMKSCSKTTKSTRQRKDVFAFSMDAPLTIGGKDKTFTSTSPISCSDFHDSSVPRTTEKTAQPVAKEKRYVKKHLFSDTDTDYTMTEASWLKESSRKPKPQITNYSRPTHAKPKVVSPHISNESTDLPPPSTKPVKGNSKSNNKKPDVKKAAEQPKKTAKPSAPPDRPRAAGRRPQRAAATAAKSYRDPDTDDSQSESDNHVAPKARDFPISFKELAKADKTYETAQVRKKKTASKQTAKICLKPESNHHSSQSESESVAENQPPISKKHFVGQQKKSENTCLQVPRVKKNKSTSEQSVDTNKKPDCYNQSDLKKTSCLKLRPENVLQEDTEFNESNFVPAQEQMNALEESQSACQASLSPSLPFNENMRSAERSIPTLGLTFSPLLPLRVSPLPAFPDSPCRDTPSPILLLPKPHSAASSKGNFKPSSLYSVEKKHSTFNAQSIRSLSPLPSLASRGQTPAVETCPVQQRLFSAPRSPLSLSAEPLFTSTQLELDKPPVPFPQSPFLEDTINYDGHHGYKNVSPVSQMSLSQSSALSIASLAVSHKGEKTPNSEGNLAQFHMSGPSRKRHVFLSNNSEEDEMEERKKSKMRGQRSPRMRPRKLFKSSTRLHGQAQNRLGEEGNKENRRNDRTPKVTKERISGEDPNVKNNSVKGTSPGTVAGVSAEGSQTVSSSHTMSFSHWEAETAVGDMDMDEDLELPETSINPSNLCQHFSSELKRKFQNRFQMMEVYNKQSLKTVQEHVSSLSTQVTKYRTQRLEKVKKVLLEEIHKLEQDDTVLTNMEKDLTIYWRKQSMAFHSFQEQETRRNVSLKKALQSNMCHSLEYEERIFTSQMCLIRKDMKSVQDRLLSEMQEGEIRSVKRGLHSLFFP